MVSTVLLPRVAVKTPRCGSVAVPVTSDAVCQSDRVRLVSPFWYLAALFLVIGGWMAGVVVAAGAWDAVRDAELVNTSDRVDAAGGSLAVFTDVRQPERGVTCTTKGPEKGARPVEVEGAPIDLTVARDGSTWYLIGFQPQGRDDVAVRCTPRDRAADAATYRAAVAEGMDARANLGNGIGWIVTAVGVGLAVATWWSRRTRPQED